ncbi:MAG: Orotidine 5'-phosphate decarboxylase (EC [uncultured Thiotrichaceae bacterium]|uniref:Orotidine 5'-phosphate decarboxylase n=1 Tax=uncultured Thiotrichaceae bacterium TaxID=298394 RepID=A0A6S6U7X5_9GAMM|nr:MAG: Orotidine 5'-phosphate decarboxylase (EC [uncultured Thiotrichaceae bacterium]
MSSRLIVALDFPDTERALSFVALLSPADCKLKVGFELFVAGGPDFVRSLVDLGFDVFLDLKFHDIPNTVAGACRAAAKLGVWMINVHAAGGDKMMRFARESLSGLENPPYLIAVTVLTSMDAEQLHQTGVMADSPDDQVKHLAKLTRESGLDGVVCSAQEARMLRETLGNDFLLVTPGIRPEGSQQGDQSRVMTPEAANAVGVDYVVVGRPVTQSDDPLAVIAQINQALL